MTGDGSDSTAFTSAVLWQEIMAGDYVFVTCAEGEGQYLPYLVMDTWVEEDGQRLVSVVYGDCGPTEGNPRGHCDEMVVAYAEVLGQTVVGGRE